MDVRQEIYSLAEERIWVVPEDLDPAKGVPRFTIVDTLVEQIRRSKVFICVLRDVYGTSVFEDAESVSFLETEIYQSALYHSNAHFFLMEPFNPDQRLSGLLDVIRTIRPGMIPDTAQPRQTVLDGIKRVLDRTQRGRRKEWSVSLRNLVKQLAMVRGHPRPDIELFDKTFRPVSRRPDKDHIKVLLNQIAQEPDIEKRLTRMWVALRELSAAPYDDAAFSEYLPYWDKALGAWASAAAWYGLHGHLYAGRLAAVNSSLRVRERMDANAQDESAEYYIQGTAGARASEYYSIAKLMPSPQEREHYFTLALVDIDKALHRASGDLSGYLAIKGHILAQTGRAQDALTIFQEVLRMREARGDDGGIGEASSDLGLMHLRLRNLKDASRLLARGVQLLDQAAVPTFAIRARKRLALSHLTTGHPLRALRELCSAYETAQKHHVYDQVTPLMKAIHSLSRALGICRRQTF